MGIKETEAELRGQCWGSEDNIITIELVERKELCRIGNGRASKVYTVACTVCPFERVDASEYLAK